MNEDRNTTRQSFFSRVFAGSTEGEGTSIYSSEEIGMLGTDESEGLAAHGFTVERAAEVIRNLPPEVPRPAAVRIVRGTLEAAGIDIAELESSTRARESKLNSEIDLSENRIQQLKDETEEEGKISAAESGLDNIDMVRDFFGLQQEDAGEPLADPAGEETQVMEGVEEEEDEDDTQVLRHPGPLSDSEDYLEPGDNKEQ